MVMDLQELLGREVDLEVEGTLRPMLLKVQTATKN